MWSGVIWLRIGFKWRNVLNTVKNLGGSINCREILEELSNY